MLDRDWMQGNSTYLPGALQPCEPYSTKALSSILSYLAAAMTEAGDMTVMWMFLEDIQALNGIADGKLLGRHGTTTYSTCQDTLAQCGELRYAHIAHTSYRTRSAIYHTLLSGGVCLVLTIITDFCLTR